MNGTGEIGDYSKIAKITKVNKKSTVLENKMMKNICNDFIKDFESPLNFANKLSGNNKCSVGSTILNKDKTSIKDDDFIITLTKRLNVVEVELKENKSRVQELNEENQRFKKEIEKLRIEKEVIKSSTNNYLKCSNCPKLKNHIKKLDEYISELKEFIKDQGFVIMHPSPSLTEDDRLESINTKIKNLVDELNISVDLNKNEDSYEYEEDSELSELERKIPQEIDINIISKRIDEMNHLIYKDGNSKFEMDEDKIFKLKQAKEIKIFFYKNGIIIEGFKFYTFNSIEAKRILHDILDGYSPYIMKKSHPDGAILKAVNNLHKDYDEKELFSNNVKSISDPKIKQKKISGEEFLNKFPEKVIKNGKVFNIREDMENFIITKNNNEYNLEQDEHFIKCTNEDLSLEGHICKLKIKINLVDKIINFNILKTEKFSVLFDYIKNLINSNPKAKLLKKLMIEKIDDWVLYTTYPFKIFKYDEITNLESNGLFPSHFLIFEEYKNLSMK
jgi:hypothetical protein